MTRESIPLTVLFADISNSTHLYEKLKDEMAQNFIASCLSILSEITVQHKGRVIKTIGDNVMCLFQESNDAVEAAIDMNHGLKRIPGLVEALTSPPDLHIGIHYGKVIWSGNDVFGDAVIVAARMVEMAKARQILTTEQTVKEISSEFQNSIQLIDITTLKGKVGEVNVFEIVWEHHDLTFIGKDPLSAMTFQLFMEIRFGDRTIELDQNFPTLTLGRQDHNDLVVADNHASRSHCRMEYRRGKFVLIDHSTNGTYILPEGEKEIRIKREEKSLHGSGSIVLGRNVGPNSSNTIHYKVKPREKFR